MSLSSDKELKKIAYKLKIPLVDVVFKDQMPAISFIDRNINPNKKMAFIINLNDAINSNGNLNAGSHWVALWINKALQGKAVIYFDSFAVGPSIETVSFLKKLKIKRIEITNQQIQNPNSGYCGWYCIAFLYFMNKGYSLKSFLDMFDEDVEKNLNILKKIMKQIL